MKAADKNSLKELMNPIVKFSRRIVKLKSFTQQKTDLMTKIMAA